MNLLRVLQRRLVQVSLFEGGSWKLAMVEPVVETITKEGDWEEIVTGVIKELEELFPPEIVARGNESMGAFFNAFDYDTQKDFLMRAVEKYNQS